MRKLIWVLGVVMLIVLVVIVLKPRQETVSPEEAASFSAHDAAYLEMIDRNMVTGGPEKDGIPAIDNPIFVSASEADKFVKPTDQVSGVVIDGVAKAYPQSILYWHEVVNDKINDKTFSITFCPLTGTVIGYDEANLGVSGKLYNSNLVLYDRKTDAEIPQILGTAVNGPIAGETFDRFPVSVTSWQQWKTAHPDTLVLSRETGHDRDYDRNPYPDYDDIYRVWFPVAAESDAFPTKKWVTGLELNNEFLAIPKEEFKSVGTTTTTLGGEEVVITYNKDFDTITATANGKEVLSIDAFWFAWYAYHPNTEILE